MSKYITIEVSDEDAKSIIFNDDHGNGQWIEDAGQIYPFEIVSVDEAPEES